MKFRDQVRHILIALMPPTACVTERPGSPQHPTSVEFDVSWPLNCDLKRPFKMSRTIRLHIGHEVVEEFGMMTAATQCRAYQAISRFLVTKLAGFRPDHDTPKHLTPPIEHWEIDCSVLFDAASAIAPMRIPPASTVPVASPNRLH